MNIGIACIGLSAFLLATPANSQDETKLAITPSVQMLKDPALNPVDDTIWVWSLRFRLTL